MRYTIELFGKKIDFDSTRKTQMLVIDKNTNLRYIIVNDNFNVKIVQEGKGLQKIFDSVALPSGKPCPKCKGSGRID